MESMEGSSVYVAPQHRERARDRLAQAQAVRGAAAAVFRAALGSPPLRRRALEAFVGLMGEVEGEMGEGGEGGGGWGEAAACHREAQRRIVGAWGEAARGALAEGGEGGAVKRPQGQG